MASLISLTIMLSGTSRLLESACLGKHFCVLIEALVYFLLEVLIKRKDSWRRVKSIECIPLALTTERRKCQSIE